MAISEVLKLIQGFSSGHERERKNIQASQANLSTLISTAQTPEQIANAQQALSNIAGDSSRYVESSLGHQALSNVLENKTTAIDVYSDATNRAVEYIEGADFWDSSEEFENLHAKANEMVIDENGNKIAKYESSNQMISEKYNELNSMIGNIEAGQKNNLRLGKIKSSTIDGKTWNDQDLLRTLNEQKERLDAAMLASINDGVITAKEAALIMGGMNRAEFKDEKENILSEIYSGISNAEKGITGITNIERKLASNALLSDEDFDILDGFGVMDVDVGSGITLRELASRIKVGDPDPTAYRNFKAESAKILINMKNTYGQELDVLKRSHSDWTGRGYAGDVKTTMDIKDVDEELKADFIDSDKYDSIVKEREEETAILEGLDKDIEDASNEDLMNRYGTTDPDKIKTILQKGYDEEQERQVRRKRFAKEAEEFEVLDPSTIKRETTEEFVIPKLKQDPYMAPEDVPVSFSEIIDSVAENKEAKAFRWYGLDKSSLGEVMNFSGKPFEWWQLERMGSSQLRKNLNNINRDKLFGTPSAEQNQKIKSLVKKLKAYENAKERDKDKSRGYHAKEVTGAGYEAGAQLKELIEKEFQELITSFMESADDKKMFKFREKQEALKQRETQKAIKKHRKKSK